MVILFCFINLQIEIGDDIMDLANLAIVEGNIMQVNMFEAKSDLSKLVQLLESKQEDSITIARNGKPVACLTLYKPHNKRLGIAKGKILYIGDIDACNNEVAELFGV